MRRILNLRRGAFGPSGERGSVTGRASGVRRLAEDLARAARGEHDAAGSDRDLELRGLEDLRAVLRPAIRALAGSGRVVLLADAEVEGIEANAVRHALDGVMRTVGKELRRGATANLIQVSPGTTAAALASTLSFLLEGRSAFVDGQSWTVGPAAATSGVCIHTLRIPVAIVTVEVAPSTLPSDSNSLPPTLRWPSGGGSCSTEAARPRADRRN